MQQLQNKSYRELIKEYERRLSEKDKKILKKEIDEVKSYFPRTYRSVLIKIPILAVFAIVIKNFPTLWLIIPLSIIAFFMIWMLITEIRDLIRLPSFLKEKSLIIESGVVTVREIKIDRYIKINSYNDEGDHFIIEYDGQLIMIGGQEFDGIRKLKNRIEYIEIFDADKKSGYHNRVIKHGENITPYHVFKKKVPEELFNSDLWNNLTEEIPFPGKLEDFDMYIGL